MSASAMKLFLVAISLVAIFMFVSFFILLQIFPTNQLFRPTHSRAMREPSASLPIRAKCPSKWYSKRRVNCRPMGVEPSGSSWRKIYFDLSTNKNHSLRHGTWNMSKFKGNTQSFQDTTFRLWFSYR